MAHEAAKKIPPPPPQKTSEVDTNYDCRQGNKWGHQLGCEFQIDSEFALCKSLLERRTNKLPAYLSALYSTRLWSQGSICEAYIYT